MLGYFNGLGKTDFVMVQGIFTAFAVRIPLSYLLSRGASPDLFKIGLAVPASAAVSLIMCTVYLIYLSKKEKSKLNS